MARLREPQFQEQLALYKRRENLDLVSAWAPPGATSLLKTDLLEEGFGKEKLLGPCANVPIRLAIGIFRRLEVLPTRFLAGRYIALRVLRK